MLATWNAANARPNVLPYPQDRHRDRKEEGGQPYEDAREAYAETEAETGRSALEAPDCGAPRTDKDEARDAEGRFEQVGDDVARERDNGDGS